MTGLSSTLYRSAILNYQSIPLWTSIFNLTVLHCLNESCGSVVGMMVRDLFMGHWRKSSMNFGVLGSTLTQPQRSDEPCSTVPPHGGATESRCPLQSEHLSHRWTPHRARTVPPSLISRLQSFMISPHFHD